MLVFSEYIDMYVYCCRLKENSQKKITMSKRYIIVYKLQVKMLDFYTSLKN